MSMFNNNDGLMLILFMTPNTWLDTGLITVLTINYVKCARESTSSESGASLSKHSAFSSRCLPARESFPLNTC